MGRVYTSLHYTVAEQQNKFFYNTKEKNLTEHQSPRKSSLMRQLIGGG